MTFSTEGELASALREGLSELGLELDAQQQAALLRHLALIEQWNRVYNLTALRDPASMLTQHVFDSLAAVRPLERQMLASRWRGRVSMLDVGSGAGLPGVTLAVACPSLAVTCVDAVGKKAGFIRQVGVELDLNGFMAVHARVEALRPLPWQIITSRAFASLEGFVRLTTPLLAPDGVWLAMKGKVPNDEIARLPPEVEVFHVEPLTVPGSSAERCLVWMHKKGAAS